MSEAAPTAVLKEPRLLLLAMVLAWGLAIAMGWLALSVRPRQVLTLGDGWRPVRAFPNPSPITVINQAGNELASIDPATGATAPLLHGDLRHLATVAGVSSRGTLVTMSSEGTYTLWHTGENGATTSAPFPGPGRLANHERPWHVICSPDGKLLAWTNSDGATFRLHVREVATEKEVASFTGFSAASFLPDGKTLAVTKMDGTVELWDVASHQVRHFLTPPQNNKWLAPLAISADGRWLATADADQCVTVWDCATGQTHVRILNVGYPGQGFFSPDGSRLVFAIASSASWADRLIRKIPIPRALQSGQSAILGVFDVASGSELGRVPCACRHHYDFIDNQTLACLSETEDAIEVWDLPPRRVVPWYVAWPCLFLALFMTRTWWSVRCRWLANRPDAVRG